MNLYFSNFALIPSVGLLTLITINEIFTSKLQNNVPKIVLHSLALLLVSVGMLFSLLYFYKGYFQPYSYPDSYDCVGNVGQPCWIIEDKGKVTAAKTKEALALMKNMGEKKSASKRYIYT